MDVRTQVASAGAAGFAGFAGNILLGGIIGMGADAATGATLEHVPNPVSATLVPISRPPGGEAQPGAAGRTAEQLIQPPRQA